MPMNHDDAFSSALLILPDPKSDKRNPSDSECLRGEFGAEASPVSNQLSLSTSEKITRQASSGLISSVIT